MVQHIFNALGQSIHYEDWRGDFKNAGRLADEWIAIAPAADRSRAWLWRGIVHLLRGELNAATASFDQTEPAGSSDPDLALLVKTYRLLCTYERFNTFPDGCGAGAVEISARWRGSVDLASANEQWEALRKAVTAPAVLFEAWYVYNFLCNLRPLRYMLDSKRFSPAAFDTEAMLNSNLQIMSQLRDQALQAGQPALAAYASWCAADVSRRAGNDPGAAELLSEASRIAAEGDDPAGQALCCLTRGDWAAAPFSSPPIWNLALQDSSSEGSALAVTLEEIEFRQPDEAALATARQEYERAGGLFAQAGAPRGLAALNLRYAYLAFLGGDFHRATALAAAAGEQFAAAGDRRGEQLARTNEAMAELGLNNFKNAFDLAQGIGAWGRENGSFSYTLGLGILLNRFGRHCLLRCGRYETALAVYQAAGGLFQALGASVNEVQNTVDRGLILQGLGDHNGAFLLFEESIERYASLTQVYENYPGGTDVKDNLRQRTAMLAASAYQLSLQHLDTNGMERSARRLAQTLEELPGGNLDEVFSQQMEALSAGQPPTGEVALPAGIEYLSLHQMGRSVIEQAAVMVPLYRSRQARHAGEFEKEKQLWQKAMEATRQMSPPMNNFFEAVAWSEKKDFDRAAAAFRQYQELSQGQHGSFVDKLAKMMGQAAGDLGRREEALHARRRHQQAFSMWMRMHQYQEALTHQQALETVDGPEWWRHDDKPWQLLGDSAEMYEMLGRADQAREGYDRAILELESRRNTLSRDELKTAMAGDRGAQYLYFLAARAAFRRHEYAAAFAYVERGKARSLLDLLAGNTATLSAFADESETLRRWRQLNAQLSLWRGLLAGERARQPSDQARIGQLSAAVAQDEQALQHLELELREENPSFFQAVNREAPTMQLAEVAARLNEGDLLIEYAFLDDDLLIWAIDRKGLAQALHFETSAETLDYHIHLLHQACQSGGNYDSAAMLLAERLLAPLASSLAGRKKLLIIPYGAMHRLPFQALPFGEGPLGEAFAISYLPSASVIQFIKEETKVVETSVLSVGNPRGDLPRAGAEAAFVADLYHRQALLETAATEPEVRKRLPGSGLLHFATHGRLSEETPLNSALLLAGSDELTLYEMMGLRLEADLVVLSACETAIGETTRGDDVLGLTRGLLAAGARQALVTLWKVDDLSTSLLMGAFYSALRRGVLPSAALLQAQQYLRRLKRKDIDQALRKLEKEVSDPGSRQTVRQGRERRRERSQRGILLASPLTDQRGDDFSHPYYWAPFVLVGK